MSSAIKRVQPARRGQGAAINGSLAPSSGAAEPPPSADAPLQWNYVVACEARNALQVLLSGGEILLDEGIGPLGPEQRRVVERIIENARHLQSLIATLRSREEIHAADPLALIRQLKKLGY